MTGVAQLAGKVAVVTGGSRGIGRATAHALLEAGAQVVISGRTRADLDATAASLGAADRVLAVQADVAVEGDVARLFAETTTRFGGVDILVNNAAIGRMHEVATQATSDWRAMIDTNLTGVFFCSRAAIPLMTARGSGWIINISSLASRNPFAGGAGYSATKAGLDAFSHALMQEVRQRNIRVSVIAPGSVDTHFGGPSAADTSWKLGAEDIAQAVLDLVAYPTRSLPSRVEMRPSRPPK